MTHGEGLGSDPNRMCCGHPSTWDTQETGEKSKYGMWGCGYAGLWDASMWVALFFMRISLLTSAWYT